MKQELLQDIYDRLRSAFGPQRWWPGETPFEVMVGAILTQNTNWANVERAIANLKEAGRLCPRKLLSLRKAHLARLIRPSGYFNIKAERLRSFLRWYMSRTGSGDVKNLRGIRTPALRQELLGVRGIGPETADSMLLYALGRRVFVVDAYTRRFLVRHELIAAGISYEKLRAFFETRLPRSKKLYNEYHALIVNLGKDICRPRPRCDLCPLRTLLGAPVLR